MSSDELFSWIFLTVLELILIYPIISRLIKWQWFSESYYKAPPKKRQPFQEKDNPFH